MEEDPSTTQLRAGLAEYFGRMALDVGVEISPTIRSQRDTILTGRIYEEERNGRQFFVNPSHSDSSFEMDAFTKRTGLDFEITLLQIIVKPDAAHFPKLWATYFNWMHQRADEKIVLAALDQL